MKDVSELHIADPTLFKKRLNEAVAKAVPLDELAGKEEKAASEDAAKPPLSDKEIDDEIDRLAKGPLRRYEREREGAAKKLGMRVGALDRLVKAARAEGADAAGQGRPLELPEHEPWDKPIDCAALLSALRASILKFVVMAEHEADAVALWQLGTHVADAFSTYPRLVFKSAEPMSGKTTAMNETRAVVARPMSAEIISAPALYRTIEAVRPTFLLDEADNLRLFENDELRAVLNSGHGAGGNVVKLVPVGDSYEPRQFATFAPVALACIGELPGPLTTRSIFVRLKRRRADEPIVTWYADKPPTETAELGRKCARWAIDNLARLQEAEPAMPVELFNRDADNWRPLFAIADVAGGEWPQRTRNAALAMGKEAAADDKASVREQALADIRDVFRTHAGDTIFSATLVTELVKLESRPWPEFGKARRPITATALARLLKPLGIMPRTVRVGQATNKGYRRKDFDDAFERYLPPIADDAYSPSSATEGDSEPSQRHTPRAPRESEDSEPSHPESEVTDENPLSQATTKRCDGVMAEKPGGAEIARAMGQNGALSADLERVAFHLEAAAELGAPELKRFWATLDDTERAALKGHYEALLGRATAAPVGHEREPGEDEPEEDDCGPVEAGL
jgi:uncharacterized protein DUF3631